MTLNAAVNETDLQTFRREKDAGQAQHIDYGRSSPASISFLEKQLVLSEDEDGRETLVRSGSRNGGLVYGTDSDSDTASSAPTAITYASRDGPDGAETAQDFLNFYQQDDKPPGEEPPPPPPPPLVLLPPDASGERSHGGMGVYTPVLPPVLCPGAASINTIPPRILATKQQSDDDNSSVESVATAATSIPAVQKLQDDDNGKGGKYQDVWRRWRCWIIFGAFALLTGAVALILYLCLPRIIQAVVDGSQIRFESVMISEPTGTGFTAKVIGQMSRTGPFDASTDPMMLSVYYNGTIEIGRLMMPAIQLRGGGADINLTTRFNITNQTAFVWFTDQMLNGEQFEWRLVGQTNLQVLGANFPNITYDTVVPFSAMNKFEGGINVQRFNLTQNGIQQNIAVDITAQLNNPSPIGMALGDLYFDMFFRSALIGRVFSRNVTLSPGMNTMNMSGLMVGPGQSVPIANFSKLFSNYLNGRRSEIQVVGRRVILSSGLRVNWLTKSVQAMNFTVPLQVNSPLELIKNVEIKGMEMDFSAMAVDPTQPAQFSAKNVSVQFALPFDFPCNITATKNTIIVSDGEGTALAVIESRYPAAASNANNTNVIETYFPLSPMKILNNESFSQYLTRLFVGAQDNSTRMTVTSEVEADTFLGPIRLSGIQFSQQLPVHGMQGLRAINFNAKDGRISNPVIVNVTVVNGTTEYIQMDTGLILYSPSSVGAHMGDVRLELFAYGQHIGHSILPNLTVLPGDNIIQCVSYFSPDGASESAQSAGRRLISNYLSGDSSQVIMSGTLNQSTQVALLANSLSKLKLNAPMNGLRVPLVRESELKVSPITAFTDKAKARFDINNPFKAPFTIIDMKARIISSKNQTIGTMNVTLSHQANSSDLRPFTVSPSRIQTTPYYPLNLIVNMETVGLASKGVFSTFDVEARCVIGCLVGDYPVTIDYRQRKVPTSLNFL